MSSRDVAVDGLPRARSVVTQTRAVLRQLIDFRVRSLPIPFNVLRDFDKVWFHFKQPVMPIDTLGLFPRITTLQDFLNSIDSVYQSIEDTLADANARSIFRDPPEDLFGPRTRAFVLRGPRLQGEPQPGPSWPDAIYFSSGFADLGPFKRAEISVHECAHWRDNQLIQDNAQPGFENYQKMDAGLALRNAWSYSQFALDCAFGRTQPFADSD
ncbi:hypothetical protein [Amycolatopsis vastitatis]|uniref:hypothetical protein n=1 Tax=Amycolatopsis vastitatis TaxID=1905142 RepID=UPI0011775CC9|nr:hypothetical protein [Amycolatopsis vastitatis]